MVWKRISSDPITTQSCVAVENEEGKTGLASVRFVAGSARLYGSVYTDDGFDDDGLPVETIIDARPKFAV
jgi:hypothetical protein